MTYSWTNDPDPGHSPRFVFGEKGESWSERALNHFADKVIEEELRFIANFSKGSLRLYFDIDDNQFADVIEEGINNNVSSLDGLKERAMYAPTPGVPPIAEYYLELRSLLWDEFGKSIDFDMEFVSSKKATIQIDFEQPQDLEAYLDETLQRKVEGVHPFYNIPENLSD